MSGLLHTAQRLVRAVEGHRPRGLVPGLHGVAVTNAQRALEDLQRLVAERRALNETGGRRVVPLSEREAHELLSRQSVGRLAYVARAGVPDVVPVNYTWYDGTVLIRSGPGPKLQAAQRGDTVAFEVDEVDVDERVGSSAVVVGRAEVVDPREPLPVVDVWADGARRHCIRIVPTRVDGRRVC